MKKLIFCVFLIFISFTLFANETIADIHIGLGFELSTMGMGFSSVNSVVSKIGEIGFGGTFGFGWEMMDFFGGGYIMPFYWNVYVSYEFPKWFGIFYSFGWYKSGYPYTDSVLNLREKAEVGRNYMLFGLQKTFYSSSYLDRWEYIRGSYIGDPSTWRAGYWRSPGTYSYSLNIQVALMYRMKHTSVEHSNYFTPIDPDDLYKRIEKDNNSFWFFIGIKASYDFPFSINRKIKDDK